MKTSPLLALLGGALLAAQSWAAPQFIADLDIPSFDGTQLDANLFVPDTPPPAGGYPTVLFTNSWALDKHQYLLQAAKLADDGYLVMSYSTRGFGQSGGLVDVAGSNSIADASVLIDWLEANYPVGKLGMAGISYGAGISLLAAAVDPRVDAVTALSGWSNVVEGLYPNDTVNLVWGTLLVNTAFNREPIVDQIWSDLRSGRNIQGVIEFGATRSALSVVDALNTNGTAVLMSNNFADYLFKPNSMTDLYTLLEGPKKLLLNPGTHAVTETLGGNGGHIWATSYDVPAGHRVTLVIDTEGLIYQKPADTNYEIEVPYRGSRVSRLTIPHL